MTPSTVYKFAPLNGISYLLEENTLRYKTPGKLNDINEVVPNSGHILDEQMREAARWRYPNRVQLSEHLEHATLEEFTEILYRHPTWGPVTRGSSLRLAWQMSQRKFCRFGVLSLAESSENLLMWAHYCSCEVGSTTGLCIGLRASAPVFEESEYPGSGLRGLQPVRYSARRATFGAATLEERLAEIVLTKSLDWQYEREVRCLRELPLGKDHIDVHFTPEDVVEIILGPNMPLAEAQRCLRLRAERYPHAKLLLAMPHPSEFRMMFIECPTSERLLESTLRDIPDDVPPLDIPRVGVVVDPVFEEHPDRLTFEELRTFEPPFNGQLVSPYAVGDWGALLLDVSGALGEVLNEPLGDVMWLAEMMAEDYLAECARIGLHPRLDLAESGDYTGTAEEYEAEVAEEFASFIRRWHAAIHESEPLAGG